MSRIEIKTADDVPMLTISEAVIDNGIDSICDIDIRMTDETFARFFVHVYIKNGRPVVELATNTDTGSVRKTVTGVKRTRRPGKS
jgi:hypothetical protein